MTGRWWWLLRTAIAVSLFGFALQHWFADPPYRSLLWSQGLMEPIVAWWGWTWEAWVTDVTVSDGIDCLASAIGVCFALMAGAVLAPLRGRTALVVVVAMTALLSVTGCARWAAHQYDALWPLEFLLRLALPLMAWLAWHRRAPSSCQRNWLLVACAATFAGHGCYALGWYPTPLAFREMATAVLPLAGGGLTAFLIVVGVVDLLVAVMLWWPRVQQRVLLWMAFWGLATSALRLSAIDPWFPGDTLLPALGAWWERLPHVVVPLALWIWGAYADKETSDHVESETHPDPVCERSQLGRRGARAPDLA